MLTRTAERVADHAKRFVQHELESVAAELRKKVAALGVGIGMLVAAAILGLFALGFALAAAGAAFATFLPTWLALLIVGGGLVLLAGGLAAGGVTGLKKAAPPGPDFAVPEPRMTEESAKDGAG